MNLNALMSHWSLKGMVREKHILYSHDVYGSTGEYLTMRSAMICSGSMHAKILYTSNGERLRLVYADIIFTGIRDISVDSIFIKDASLTKLAEHLI